MATKPKFKPGDKVRVNGQQMTIRSWPADNVGPFLATHLNPQGGEVQVTLWAGQVDLDGEPIHTSANVELVESGEPVQSTAGPVDALD